MSFEEIEALVQSNGLRLVMPDDSQQQQQQQQQQQEEEHIAVEPLNP